MTLFKKVKVSGELGQLQGSKPECYVLKTKTCLV